MARETDTAMNKNVKLFTLAAVALALLPSVGCDRLRARDQLNKGVDSYKNSHFEQAIEHFKNAFEAVGHGQMFS